MSRSYFQNNFGSDVKWPDGSLTGNSNISKQNREYIAELDSGVMKGFIAGIIIAKQDPRSFIDRKWKDPNQLRWQLKFTIRDSINDFINVCCWGGDAFVNDLSRSYKIGDIVKIENGLVQKKLNTEAELKYNPSTPSEFNITLNEAHTIIQHYDQNEAREFHEIAFLPTKDTNDYYTLSDIIANGQNLNGTHINILAALRNAGEERHFMSKNGKQMQRRELKIFDQSCPSFPLVMWDKELSELAETWNPQEVVFFIADVHIHFDNFRNCMLATCDGKTIIIVNPDIPEAHHLYNYVQSIDLKDFTNSQEETVVDIENIDETFTIEEMQEKFDKKDPQCSVFHGIVNAAITYFDIDSLDALKIALSCKCGLCKKSLTSGKCSNLNCSSYNQLDAVDIENGSTLIPKQLDFRIALSDITGGLSGFRIQGKAAEQLVGCNVTEFLALNDYERTELKWRFLFEQYKVIFKYTLSKRDNFPYLDVIRITPCDIK
eukprot:gene9098-10069_t